MKILLTLIYYYLLILIVEIKYLSRFYLVLEFILDHGFINGGFCSTVVSSRFYSYINVERVWVWLLL